MLAYYPALWHYSICTSLRYRYLRCAAPISFVQPVGISPVAIYVMAASDIPTRDTARVENRKIRVSKRKSNIMLDITLLALPQQVLCLKVRAVVYYDDRTSGEAPQERRFETEFMDIEAMSQTYPISADTGIDTLPMMIDAQHQDSATVVFYLYDGREIPDPRIYLEDRA